MIEKNDMAGQPVTIDLANKRTRLIRALAEIDAARRAIARATIQLQTVDSDAGATAASIGFKTGELRERLFAQITEG